MIAVDTSALFAIALGEPQASACRSVLRAESQLLISAGTLAEALIVAGHRGFEDALMAIIENFGIEVVPVTAVTARGVAAAHQRWGKGVHPAGLNFGDCFAYQAAEARACPLLFVGDYFAKTDVRGVL